jgi:hypothetical protein
VVDAAVKRRAGETSFVRSFAYVSGPLYGFLLDGSGPDWRKHMTKDTDAATLLGQRLKVSPRPDAVRIAQKYDGATLRAAEDERERKRTAQITAWRRTLVDGPVLIVDVKGASITFNPHHVFPVSETEVVYTSCEYIAEWGTLTVEGDTPLLLKNGTQARVSLASGGGDHTRGEGWTLKLNEGWSLVAADRTGDFTARKR